MFYEIKTIDDKGEKIITRRFRTTNDINWLENAKDNIAELLIDSEEKLNEIQDEK